MKEVEKNEIKRLSDRLDAIRHQQAELSLVEAADKYAELEKEKATLEAEIERLRSVQSQKLSKEAQKLMSLRSLPIPSWVKLARPIKGIRVDDNEWLIRCCS